VPQPVRHTGALWIAACLVLLASCGYRFTGSGDLPAGIDTVAVHVFENRTAETGAEAIFTNDFIYELTRSGKVKVVDAPLAAATIYGTIQSLSVDNISHRTVNASNERRVSVVVDLRLVKAGGRVVRSMRGIHEYEEYRVTGDKLATEANRRQAIQLLSQRLAEKMFNRMTEEF
jgi:outer membrane lipopolysaccharide assembly protein LptE/RlpB